MRLGLDKAHPLGVSRLEVAAEYAGNAAPAVECDVHQKIDADLSHNLEQRLMERVADDDSRPDSALEHGRAVCHTNRLHRGETWADRLSARPE